MKKNNINSDTIKHLLRISAKLAAFGFALFLFTGIINAQTNLAKGKTARQLSTRSAGGAASRAVDGNTSGVFTNNSVTHSASEAEVGSWWEVDLGAVYWINSIKVFNRTDCCGDRLKNTRIAVSMKPFKSNLSGIKYGDIVNQAEISNGQPLIFYGTRQVRYVRIFKKKWGVLSLAEVEVYGKKIKTKASSSTNIRNNTGTVKNLTGNWAGYVKDGTKSAYLWKISQNGSTLSIKEINTSQNLVSKGRISGNQVSATDFGSRGTLSTDGNRINWANGESWRKESPTSGNSSANNQSSTSTSTGKSKLTTGFWNVYTSQGNLVTSYKTIVSRSSGKTFVHLGTNRREANIQGNRISVPGLNATGTITDDGNRIAWSNKTIWTRPGYARLQNSNSNKNSNTPIARNDGNIATTPKINTETKVEPDGENTEIASNEDDDGDESVIPGSTDKSKALPASIATYLDSQFTGWEISPESELCGEKKLFQTGDFDGDGKTDYAVYFVVGKNSTNAKQILYAFLNKGAYFKPLKISEDKDPKNFKFSSFAIIKKGETLQTGEGSEDILILNFDAITEYLCETDASATYVFGDGKFSALELYQP